MEISLIAVKCVCILLLKIIPNYSSQCMIGIRSTYVQGNNLTLYVKNINSKYTRFTQMIILISIQ